MNKIDYNNLMIQQCRQVCDKPKLLLHTCCAVCAGGVLAREIIIGEGDKRRKIVDDKLVIRGETAVGDENVVCSKNTAMKLTDFFDVTLYFSNDNMDTEEEYYLRAGQCEKLVNHFGVKLVVAEYVPTDFERVAIGLENEREQGGRCTKCITMRVGKSADYASKNDYEYVGSTLTISPHKNASLVNAALETACKDCGLKVLYSDFKKQSGFLTANKTAEKLNIYRQSYCGCRFAK